MRRGLWFALAILGAMSAAHFFRGGSGGGRADGGGLRSSAPALRDGTATTTLRLAGAGSAAAPILSGPGAGGLRLEGQVIDSEERPVPGAVVALDSRPARTVTAGADGSFVFVGLPPRAYRLEARADERVAGPIAVRLEEHTEPVVLRLKAASTVEIAVSNGERRPVAAATVELRGLTPLTATADDRGLARLVGVTAGLARLKVAAPGYAATWQRVELSGALGERHLVTLARGVRVAGRVSDEVGRPVAGARVLAASSASIFADLDAELDAVVSDADGRWQWEALAPGSYRFDASEASHVSASSAAVMVANEPRGDVAITLPRGVRVSGRVVGSDGSSVAGATVRVVVDDGRFVRGPERETLSGPDGGFLLAGLPAARLRLVAATAEAASPTRVLDVGRGDPGPLTLVLDGGGELAGVVVGPDGRALPEAPVLADALVASDRGELALRGHFSSLSDGAGRFRLRGLPPGRYLVKAAPPASALRPEPSWQRDSVTAAVGTRDLRLVVVGDGTLTARVLFDDGEAPASVAVAVDGALPIACSGGRVRLDGVPAGGHRLVISGSGFPRVTVDVTAVAGRERNLGVITVGHGRELQGRVLDLAGAPVSGARVVAGKQLLGDGGQLAPAGLSGIVATVETRSGSDGRFAFAGLEEGGLTVAAEASAGRSALTPVAGGADSVDLVLRPTGTLEGIVNKGQRPAAGVNVQAVDLEAPSSSFTVRTGSDGHYRFDALAAGAYRLVFQFHGGADGDQLSDRAASVVADQTVRADVTLPDGGTTLTVTAAADPGSVTSAYVFLLADDGGAHQFHAISAAAPVQLRDVAPGSYRLCVLPNLAADTMASAQSRCRSVDVDRAPQQLSITLPAS